MNLRPEEISQIIKDQIKNYKSKIEMTETGNVILVGDGIARVYGLRSCMASELLEFDDGSFGMAQNLENETVSVAILSDENNIREGTLVKRTGRVLSVPVGEGMLGRVVNALGQPIDGKGPTGCQEGASDRIGSSRHHRTQERIGAASNRNQGYRQHDTDRPRSA